MNNIYVDCLYKAVHKNRYDLDAVIELDKAIDNHSEKLADLQALVKTQIQSLLDYDRQFNMPANNVNRGVTVIWPDWEPIMSFKTIKEAAHACWVNPKSASNILQKKQLTAWDWFSFKWADDL